MKANYRNVCLDSKGEQCRISGSTEQVVVHHVDGDRDNNEIDNLEPLCESCHGKVHTGSDGYEEWHGQLDPSARIYDGDSVRDRKNVNMYLPEELIELTEFGFDSFNIQWMRAGGDKLEKNRHFRPLIIELGLEQFAEMSIDEVVEKLETSPRLDSLSSEDEDQ